ncbi:MAG: alpha-glucan family phosphorylase [Burkholderiaceae bacterium]
MGLPFMIFTTHPSGVRLPGDLPADLDGLNALVELALDLRWSWNHGADALWRRFDPRLWDMTRNPWALLQTVSPHRIEALLADPVFRGEVDAMHATTRELADNPAWFQRTQPPAALAQVAYFSLEFMLSETLPIYSGGLGNVAGDQLKAAGDLGVPVVGVGLLYQQGYFRQVIDSDGAQQALYPYNDPGQMPVTPVRTADGDWLRIEVALPGYSVWLRAWQVRVGRVRLYLLDTNDIANFPIHRGITSELYGGGPELRLKQEIVLGIGGCRLLSALGIEADVFHLNEGHAALAVLERARTFMARSGQPFAVALAATRAGNLFTTHTAVSAGFDHYSPALVTQFLGHYAESLGITLKELLALGRQNADDASEDFNMAYLAVRGSGQVNAVSRLHGEVSRKLFAPLFPRCPAAEVPVGHVTNGVHVPSWDSAVSDRLWSDTCGQDRWLIGETDRLSSRIRDLPDTTLWDARVTARTKLVDDARARMALQVALSGGSAEAIEVAGQCLDANVLTLGFAKRFAAYKRPNLLLHDPERLLRLLNDVERPVQLILAGKAHPADREGQQLILRWSQMIRRPAARSRIVFLADYDMRLTEQLVQGVDVWLNTPRRPWEACGTSGMKVLVNGGLNLSELDGWWAEAYTPETGWSLGDRNERADDGASDAADAEQMYERLEQTVVPAFYARDERGIPVAWVAKIRESMAALTPVYSAARAVREYTERHYLPAAAAYRSRSADNGALGKQLVDRRKRLDRGWAAVRFGRFAFETRGSRHLFEVHVELGGIDPDMVRVELFADSQDGAPCVVTMDRATGNSSTGNTFESYVATVASTRAPQDYTARLLPDFRGTTNLLDDHRILWQR